MSDLLPNYFPAKVFHRFRYGQCRLSAASARQNLPLMDESVFFPSSLVPSPPLSFAKQENNSYTGRNRSEGREMSLVQLKG